MTWTIIFSILFLALFFVTLLFVKQGDNWKWASGFVTLFIFFLLVVFISPEEFGWGHVPSSAGVLSERLSNGVVYHLISSVKIDSSSVKVTSKNQILLVRKDGTSDYYAIRVLGEIPPPEDFILVKGKAFAIAKCQ